MPLTGRDDEQRAIEALLTDARVGQSGALLLVGDPGIGKTALLRHAEAAASGFRVLRATGSEAEHDLPFAALATLVRPLEARIDDLPAPQAQALSVAVALREGVVVDRFAVSAALLGLVTEAAEERPVALLVDDAHLVDRPSAEAIVFTARRVLADRVVVLATLRSGGGSWWATAGLPVLPIGELDPASTATLAGRAAAAPLSPAQQDRIVRLSRGNPLAAISLAADLLATDQVGGDSSADADLDHLVPPPVPEVVAQAFGRRVAGLDPEVLLLLQLAAVADGDLALVARVARAERLAITGLAAAEARRLVVVRDDRVEFEHPLTRSAVYAMATPQTRRELHRWVADAAADADRRAWHLSAAAVGPDEQVSADLEAVAARAGDRGAHAVAVSAYERAARLSLEPGQRARRFLAAGEAAWIAGADDRAPALLRAAVAEDGSARTRSRAGALEGLVAARSGSLREARDLLLGAGDEVAPEAPGEALGLYAEVVDVCFYLLDTATAQVAEERALRLLEGGAALPEREAALARIAVGMARILRGEPGAESIRTGVEALTRLAPADARVQAAWEVIGPLFLREADSGRELLARAVQQRRAASGVGTLPHLLFHLARHDATTDRWTRAEAAYGEALALAGESGQLTEQAASLAGLAWLLGRQGRADECRTKADEADLLAADRGLLMVPVWTALARAELDLSVGAVREAAERYAALAERLDALGALDPDLSPVPELVETRLRLGEPVPAGAVERFLGTARAKGQPWALARAARVEGMLSDDEAMDEPFARALDLHERTADAFERARTLLVYGERLRRSRRRVDAREPLGRALADLERLGARAWAEVAEGELRATGLTVQRSVPGGVIELTPRELQIALLLADGRTTREAAAALFLSPKTVEYHLRHVYTKLAIGSRTELAERLRDTAR